MRTIRTRHGRVSTLAATAMLVPLPALQFAGDGERPGLPPGVKTVLDDGAATGTEPEGVALEHEVLE